jgi:DNA-directed RNA polymerase specialized sigma24 family protein
MNSHSDWEKNYQRARRYCIKLLNEESPVDKTMTHGDLVHDVYLKWYEQKNENVFINSIGRTARIIKNINAGRLRKSKWYWNGKVSHRVSSDSAAAFKQNDNFEEAKMEVLFGWGYKFPSQDFEERDAIDQLKSKLSEMELKVLDLKLEGYGSGEIEKIVKRSNPIIGKALQNIKKQMMHLKLNPFNGSKVKVVKKISRKTYEANADQYQDFEKGDEFLENEYYTLLTSKENPKEGLLIKENIKD